MRMPADTAHGLGEAGASILRHRRLLRLKATTIAWTLAFVAIAVLVSHYLFPSAFEGVRVATPIDDFMGNLLTTMVGAFAGIFLALEVETKKETERRKEGTRQILTYVAAELQRNLDELEGIKGALEREPEKVSVLGSVDELWTVLLNDGRLQWIDDFGLIASIANAYVYIRKLKQLEGMHLDYLLNTADAVTAREELRNRHGAQVLFNAERVARDLAVKYINAAFKKIDMAAAELGGTRIVKHQESTAPPVPTAENGGNHEAN